MNTVISNYQTRTVASRKPLCKLVRTCLILSGLTSLGVWATDNTAQLQNLHNSERLELQYGQQKYRDRLEPLEAVKQRQLEFRLDQQRRDQQLLQQKQLQKQRALNRKLQVSPSSDSSARAKQDRELQKFRAEQRQQQLRLEIQRQSWPYPKR